MVSSAKSLIIDATLSETSLMKTRNRQGPKTDP